MAAGAQCSAVDRLHERLKDRMPIVGPAAAALPGSGIREIVNLALARPPGSVARLEIGEPDSRTPEHVAAAAAEAMSGRVVYTQSAGMPVLREALIGRLNERYGFGLELPQLVLSQGAVQGISAVFQALLSPGDEVLLPDPAWPNYEMQALLVGARPTPYALRAGAGFLPDLAELERLMTPRVRIIVINSPSNPTGAVMDHDTTRAVVELAASRGVVVVSDEVYDDIVFEGTHVNARQFAPDSVISVYSFSKTYSMTGWRVGYLAVPSWLSAVLERVQESQLSCLSQVSQLAALAAVTGPQQSVAVNRERYHGRRDRVVRRMRDAGVEVVVPGGAFYLMVPLGEGVDSRQAALDLVGAGVSVAPGTAFGVEARHLVRISLASPDDELDTGVGRLLDWYARTDGGAALALSEARGR
jgi:aspartate/methionine/tyrosine aminotransferase